MENQRERATTITTKNVLYHYLSILYDIYCVMLLFTHWECGYSQAVNNLWRNPSCSPPREFSVSCSQDLALLVQQPSDIT